MTTYGVPVVAPRRTTPWWGIIATVLGLIAIIMLAGLLLRSCNGGGGGITPTPQPTTQPEPQFQNTWPSVECERTGEHPATVEGPQGRVIMHSVPDIVRDGDRCTLTVPAGVTISLVNSVAGSGTINGQQLTMGNPVKVGNITSWAGPATMTIVWQAGNDSNSASWLMARP